jgi:hypothetical protein
MGKYIYDVQECFELINGDPRIFPIKLFETLRSVKKYIKELNEDLTKQKLKLWKIDAETNSLIKYKSKSCPYYILIVRRKLYAGN